MLFLTSTFRIKKREAAEIREQRRGCLFLIILPGVFGGVRAEQDRADGTAPASPAVSPVHSTQPATHPIWATSRCHRIPPHCATESPIRRTQPLGQAINATLDTARATPLDVGARRTSRVSGLQTGWTWGKKSVGVSTYAESLVLRR